MSLFYSKVSKLELTSYANACYMIYPHNGRSQIHYMFTYGDTTTS